MVVDKETKHKVKELEKQLKQIKGTNSLGSVNFSYLCTAWFEVSSKIQCLDFENYGCRSCCYAHLKIYEVAMARYRDNDRLLDQTFPNRPNMVY